MADSNFILYLILYHKTLARATGVTFDTRLIRDLVSYYVMLRRRESETTRDRMTAGYLKGIISGGRDEIIRLVSEADTADKRLEILPAVERIEAQITEAANRLERLADG